MTRPRPYPDPSRRPASLHSPGVGTRADSSSILPRHRTCRLVGWSLSSSTPSADSGVGGAAWICITKASCGIDRRRVKAVYQPVSLSGKNNGRLQTQLAGREAADGPLSAPRGHPVYAHNPLSLTASFHAAPHANAGVSPTRSQAEGGWPSDSGEISGNAEEDSGYTNHKTKQVQKSQP